MTVVAASGMCGSAAALNVSHRSGTSLPPTCSLLSNAEVGKALGAKIQTRQRRRFGCTWQSVPLGKFTSVAAGLELDAAPLARDKFKSMPKRDPALTRFGGVGQLAFVSPDGNGSYVLYVWQHGVYLQLSADRVPSPLETEKALAKVILERL